jgi:hypothetical protein
MQLLLKYVLFLECKMTTLATRNLQLASSFDNDVQLTYIASRIEVYETMLPVVSYGCETCSLKLGEEHRLRVLKGC